MPEMMDLFNNQVFRRVEITNYLQQLVPVPTLLGTLGVDLFRTVPVRTRQIAIIKRPGERALIPTSPIGAPPVELELKGGEMRPFFTRRIAKGSTVYAEELQGITLFPEFQAVQTLQAEVAARGTRIRDDVELTNEFQRFGAVQGKTIDADGTTVLDDWFANWGVPAPTPFNFHLDVDTTDLRAICDAIRRAMQLSAPDAWVPGRTRVHCLAGDAFFTALASHPMVERLYLQTPQAQQLAQPFDDVLDIFGVVFHRWAGLVGSEFEIPADEARFFPVGANEVFQKILAPAEFDPYINQPGQEVYGMTIPDRDRGAWLRTEIYQYPLFMCIRPEILQKGIAQ